MNRLFFVSVLLPFCLLTGLLSAQDYELTTLDFPGGLLGWTQAYGINAQGDIVGFYVSADGVPHSFLYRNGEWITLDLEYPTDEYFTDIKGINPSGDLIGTTAMKYWWEDCGQIDGFYSVRGSMEAITYPGAHQTWIEGINPKGVMVGEACAIEYPEPCVGVWLWCDGFILENGVFTPLNPPNAHPLGTSALDINAAGDVLGRYVDTVFWEEHRFVLTGGTYIDIEAPEGVSDFGPVAIGPNGILAGNYDHSSGSIKGFVLDQDDFISVEMPGAFHTIVNDISPSGVIVGRYLDGIGYGHHGFVGRPCPDGQTCSQEP